MNKLTIGTHLTTTNDPYKLAGYTLYKILDKNYPLWTHFHFKNPVAAREYLTIQKFLEDKTLTSHEKNTHESLIIYLSKEKITHLVPPLTLDINK